MNRARLLFAALLVACPVDPGVPDGGSDAGSDAGPVVPRSTDHCVYEEVPATANAGGTVTAGAITVGTAELPLDLPVGTALGGNTSRAEPLDDQGHIDDREVRLSGSFTPSVGYESIPMVKAVAITAGDETVILLRTDTCFGDDSITHEVTERLGTEYAGKVLWTSSHSHTGPAQFTGDLKLQVGGGPTSLTVRNRLIDRLVEAAQAALAAREPAQIGIATNEDFDPEHHVSFDRREENDALFGGEPAKDSRLLVIRIDRMDGTPLAILPLFGVHSAILDDDVSVYSTDASGAFERQIEERFDVPVTVIHLQGAGGDVLGESHSHLEYDDGELRWDFARSEECARYAVVEIMEAWERAGEGMESEIAMEMVTRTVPLGPDWETFTIRDGALSYAPFDGRRPADRTIYDDDGAVASPIDEFNAPTGAALCGESEALPIPRAGLPNTEELGPYLSCAQLENATRVLGPLLDFEFGDHPLCTSTRTTVGALRLGEYLFGIAPGEPMILFRDHVASHSPYPVERTFVIGYALGHEGYLVTPEDWLIGGYEPSINSWGPLEGEYVAERIEELLVLAASDTREDAAAGGVDRVVPTIPEFDRAEPPDPAPMAGTVPATVPEEVYFRRRAHPVTGQPDATIPRVTGIARFVWIGEDPMAGTPRVTLQREVDGTFEPVRRRSGRPVIDMDFIVVWTPQPLQDRDEPRTHYWTVEWQAVAPIGDPDLPELEGRAGVALGDYRFHVEGTGYTIDSAPFEVVAGPIDAAVTASGADFAITAHYQPAEGWRLMTMDGLADADVPVTAGPLSVTIEYATGAPETLEAPISAPGMASVTPSRTGVMRVIVRDRFGNEGTATP